MIVFVNCELLTLNWNKKLLQNFSSWNLIKFSQFRSSILRFSLMISWLIALSAKDITHISKPKVSTEILLNPMSDYVDPWEKVRNLRMKYQSTTMRKYYSLTCICWWVLQDPSYWILDSGVQNFYFGPQWPILYFGL